MRGKMTTKSTSPAATGTSASESPFHWEEVRATEAPDLAQPPKEATQEGGQARRLSRSQGRLTVLAQHLGLS